MGVFLSCSPTPPSNEERNWMISIGYEKALFDSPVSDRRAIAHSDQSDPGHSTFKVRNEEFDLLRGLRRAARVVKQVVDSKENLFNVVPGWRPKGVLRIEATHLGSRFMTLRKVLEDDIERYFPKHGFNPYVELLFRARREVGGDLAYGDYWEYSRGEEAVQRAAKLNEFVNHLRKLAGEGEFKATLDRFRRCCDKNTRSVRRYIDAIFQHRGSRHLVIRLDIGYAMEEAWVAARPTSVTLQQAKDDLVKFQRYLREHLPVTGFVAKLEYGLLRGYHFHVLIFLNGHLVQKDVLIAQRLGEHWATGICEGKGRYWNCNAQEYEHRGIGIADDDARGTRARLLDAVPAGRQDTVQGADAGAGPGERPAPRASS